MTSAVFVCRPVRELVVTGLGLVTDQGVGVEAFSRSLFSSPEGQANTTTSSGPQTRLSDLDSETFIEPNRARRLDPLSRLAVVAASLASQDAGWERATRDDPRIDTGVSFGSGWGCLATAQRYAGKLVDQGARFTNPIDFPDSIDGAPAAHVALELGLGGPSSTYPDGALAGEMALLGGVFALQSGRAQRILVGGGDMFSPTLDHPALGCLRTRGEGVGFLAIEAGPAARLRGAKIYAGLEWIAQSVPPLNPFSSSSDAALSAVLRRASALEENRAPGVDLLSFSSASGRAPCLDEEAIRSVVPPRPHAVYGFDAAGRVAQFPGAGVLRLAAASLALRYGLVPPSADIGGILEFSRCACLRHPLQVPLQRVIHLAQGSAGAGMAILLKSPEVTTPGRCGEEVKL